MNTVPKTSPGLKAFLAVCLLNGLLFFPILYQSYKHYDTRLTPWDVGAYMSLVDKPGEFEPPFRFRIIAPWLTRLMRAAPAYDIEINFTEDPASKRDFFHFSILNAAFCVAVSAMLFLYLTKAMQARWAYLGSLLYLFSFYGVVTDIIPMTDTSCHFFIMAAILLFQARKPWAFALACLFGVFSKETMLIVLGGWIAIGSLKDRGVLRYLAYMLPAAAAYYAATRIWPAETEFNYYQPGFLEGRLFRAFNPREYNGSFIFHVFLSQAPFLLAIAAYAILKAKGALRDMRFVPEVWLFPFLIWLGMTLDLGNSTGRVAYMAFPAMVQFQCMVLRAWTARYLPCLGESDPALS